MRESPFHMLYIHRLAFQSMGQRPTADCSDMVYKKLRSICIIYGKLRDSAHCMANKSDRCTKKCEICGGNHTENYRRFQIYKDGFIPE